MKPISKENIEEIEENKVLLLQVEDLFKGSIKLDKQENLF